jgi:hypothetical protein
MIMDHPLTRYLVIGVFSLGAGLMFWRLGGNFASVVTEKGFLGVTFELGGAIAGFGAVFWLSLQAFERLSALEPQNNSFRKVKVFLVPRETFAKEEEYKCRIWIYDDENDEERIVETAPHRENGHLTIDLRDLQASERFRIELRNTSDSTWRSEYCHPSAPRAEMYPYAS